MSKESYYEETISESCNENGINLTVEQIRLVAKDVAMSHEMYSEYSGARYIPNPSNTELERKLMATEKELTDLRKVISNAQDRMAEKYRVSPSQVSLDSDGGFYISPR